jgi:hypothetical protein
LTLVEGVSPRQPTTLIEHRANATRRDLQMASDKECIAGLLGTRAPSSNEKI